MNRKPNFLNALLSVLVGLTLILSAVQPVNVSASASPAQGDGIRRGVHPQTGKLSFLGADPSSPLRVSAAMGSGLAPEARGNSILEMYGSEFGIQDAARELSVMKSSSVDGRLSVRYQQVYNDVPVMAGELIVNMMADGSLLSINGEASPNLKVDTQPKITAEAARQLALHAIATTYNLNAGDLTVSEPALWIFDERLVQENATQPVHLVWRMEVTSENAPLRELVLVNAKTGKISLHFNQIDTAWAGEQATVKVSYIKGDVIEPPVASVTEPVPAPDTGVNMPLAVDSSLNRFVALTGVDTGNCSDYANPCLTINHAIGQAIAGDTIGVAEGTYTGNGTEVVLINKSVNLSGGWNTGFDAQTGYATIDGGKARKGIAVYDNDYGSSFPVSIAHFAITNTIGGGILNAENLTVQFSTLYGNADYAIDQSAGTLTVINSTVSGNNGLGVFIYSGTTNLHFVTISNNHATDNAGIYKYSGVLNFDHTILYNNSSTAGGGQCTSIIAGNFNSLGHNIIETTCASATEQPTDKFNTDPKLSAFLPVQGYQPLRSDSPAIDAGDDLNCDPTDQRGAARVDIGSDGTACDIGAYEYTPPGAAVSIWASEGNYQHTNPGAAFSEPLTAVVLDSQGSPVSGVNVTFTASLSGPGGTFAGGTNVDGPIPTDAGGRAITSVITANSELGSFAVSADAGLGSTAEFSLENLAWYVSPSGDDANSCQSPAEPCATINGAISKAYDGDQIFVAMGTYVGSDSHVVNLSKIIRLSGGWDSAFSTQVGLSIIDGEHVRYGFYFGMYGGNNIPDASIIDHFAVIHATTGIVKDDGTLIVRNSSLHHNDGAGMANSGTFLTLENVTISNNVGEGIGSYGSVTMTNTTISENGGTGFRHVSGTTIIRNTIIYGNAKNSTTFDCVGPTYNGSITSEGNNIIGNIAGCTIVPIASDQFNADAGLAVFLPSLGYQPLLSASTAIGNGNPALCPALDQRGVDRLGDAACDIGAYEYTSPGATSNLIILAGDNQRVPIHQSFPVQFSVVALDNLGSPVPNAAVSFTVPGTGASGTFAGGTSIISGESGIVTAPVFTANAETGAYFVNVDAVTANINIAAENGAWYVSQAGSDANTCTSAGDPCASINGALGKAGFRKGDTILVEQGTYSGVVPGYIVTISTDAKLQGGWNSVFTAQVGFSILDGQSRFSGLKTETYTTVWIDHFIMRNGKTGTQGGGILNRGTLYFSYGSVNNNVSDLYGGGIFNGGSLWLSNVTISQNTSRRSGGGLYNAGKAVNLKHVTISQNRSTEDGGGGYYQLSSWNWATFENSILADNFGSSGASDCYGTIASFGNNIIKNMTGCTISAAQPTDKLNIDPALGTFLPWQGYQPLLSTSPAIDSVDPSTCLAYDQRSVTRPQGAACDIGAYEYKTAGAAASISPVASASNARVNITESPTTPLQVVVLDADGSPVPGIEVIFTAPASGAGGNFTSTGSNISNPIPTDANGIATAADYVANIELGGYSVIASTSGLTSVGIPMTNVGWFVSPTGSDINICDTKTSPCLTLDGVIMKMTPGEIILAAEGMYTNTTFTSTGSDLPRVVTIDKNLSLSGGWNADFTSQSGYSTINGQFGRRGIVVNESATARISHFRIVNGLPVNTAGFPGGGGGIENEGNLTVSDCLIFNNIAGGGGGVVNTGSMVINRTMIFKNKATSFLGGGVYNGGTLTINDSSIHDNQLLSSGDYVYSGGGGFYQDQGTATINNTTIANNFSTDTGGGIRISLGSLQLNNVTISGNRALKGGGLYNSPDYPGTIILKNTILAQNNATVSGTDCFGTAISGGYNILGVISGCTITSKPGDKFGINPNLGIFLPALGYQPLLSTSPAIDAGNPSTCTARDQRGVARPQGASCDIGAYEYAAPSAAVKISVADGDGQHAAPGEVFGTLLRAVAVDVNGSPVGGESVTFTAPLSGPGGVFSEPMTVITDENGIATAPALTANNETGPFTVSASIGAGPSVLFNLNNFLVYVRLAGSNQNDCLTPATACATITEALAVRDFQAGDKILVGIGDYSTVDSFPKLRVDSRISGGWDAAFLTQIGLSKFKEQIQVENGAKISLERVQIENFSTVLNYLGVVKNDGNLILSNSTIRNISVWGVENSGTLILDGVSIINTVTGLHNTGTATVINSTLSGNTDLGIYNDFGDILVKNSTITNNRSTNGGGIRNPGGVFRLANSIVANNVSTIGQSGDCYGTFISDGYNLIGNIGKDGNGSYYYDCRSDWLGTDLIGYVTHGGVSHKIAALLGVLTEKPGGSGIWIHPLRLGSPAIDAGNEGLTGSGGFACPATDQLGIPRPQGARCDIGAVEYKFDSYPTDSLLVTYTAKNATSLPGIQLCKSNNATCSSSDTKAKSIHKYAFSTYSQYNQWHGRNSIDGNGMQIMSAIHYGRNYANAFWNGYMLVFGDGYGFAMADDVVAHELTHGVTQYESNLFYWYQSGAINESFSDLWGEAVDQTNGLGNDAANVKWLIGEDVTGLGAVRSMSTPPSYGDPDSITSPLYCKSGDCLKDNGGVHTNSGVNNKAVYLMVNGGTFGGRNVRALGWTKTLAIYYEAQTNLLTSGSDYLDLYNALYQACLNEIGMNGIVPSDCTEVSDATLAVKMNLQPAANFNPDAPYCPVRTFRVAPDVFYDDFETGTDGWNIGALIGEPAWGLSGQNAKSGVASLWADDSNETTDSFAATRGIPLPAGSKPYLHFSHAFNFEFTGANYYDGGVLEYSINNGKTWVDTKALFSAGQNYKSAINAGVDNPLRWRSAFVGESHGYVDSRYNLTKLAGKTVRFRWRMGTDTAGFVNGWYVDDVRIYLCVGIPSVPTLSLPANNASVVSLMPLFDWSNSTPDLHHYELQLATDSAFTLNLVSYNNILVSTFTPTTDLTTATTYYWRARAFNAAGKASAWSAIWSFKTMP